MDDSTNCRLGGRLDVSLLAGRSQDWGDGSLIDPGVIGPIAYDKALNIRVIYPFTFTDGGSCCPMLGLKACLQTP